MGSVATNPFQDVPAGRVGKINHCLVIDIELTISESLEKLVTLFREDNDPRKTDLLVGVYKTDEGKAYVQPSVKEVRSLSMN